MPGARLDRVTSLLSSQSSTCRFLGNKVVALVARAIFMPASSIVFGMKWLKRVWQGLLLHSEHIHHFKVSKGMQFASL